MKLLLPEPSITQFCRVTLKVFGIYLLGYFVAVLGHIPTCWAVVHSFTQRAFESADIAQSLEMIPFYTVEELMQYGLSGELIAASFIAFLLGTALFFVALPLNIIIFGFFPRLWVLFAMILSSTWVVLGSVEHMHKGIAISLALPPFLLCSFFACAYAFLRRDEDVADDETVSEIEG